MKAAVYMGAGDIRITDVNEPECQPGQAKIRVHTTGICGTDMAIAAGKHPRAQAPLIMGHEFAGEIVEIKTDQTVPDFKVGDRVTVYPLLSCGKCLACTSGVPHVCKELRLIGIDRDGAFAEYVCAPIDKIVKLPDGMSYDRGALVEPLAVGVHAAAMAEMDKSWNAVVIGAGPIGLVTALALRLNGAKRIVLTDISASRLERATAMGFEVLNAAECDVLEKIMESTSGEGTDVLFECAGSESSAAQMCDLVRCRGKIIMVGVHKEPHKVDLRSVNFKEITMTGARVYTKEDYRKAVEAAAEIPKEHIVSHRLGLDDAARGFEYMGDPRISCKVLIDI